MYVSINLKPLEIANHNKLKSEVGSIALLCTIWYEEAARKPIQRLTRLY